VPAEIKASRHRLTTINSLVFIRNPFQVKGSFLSQLTQGKRAATRRTPLPVPP
jgi:hypothetical protein